MKSRKAFLPLTSGCGGNQVMLSSVKPARKASGSRDAVTSGKRFTSAGNHAQDCSCASARCSSAFACVDSRITGGATRASPASFQRSAQRHQRSPGLGPAKR